MLNKLLRKDSIKLEIGIAGNVVLGKALDLSADITLDEMIKCKDKSLMAVLSSKKEKESNLAYKTKLNQTNKFEYNEYDTDIIIEAVKKYKDVISVMIKKASSNEEFDLLCGEVHVCNKLYKIFSAVKGIEVLTIEEDVRKIEEA